MTGREQNLQTWIWTWFNVCRKTWNSYKSQFSKADVKTSNLITKNTMVLFVIPPQNQGTWKKIGDIFINVSPHFNVCFFDWN